jgi:hypothetical protein
MRFPGTIFILFILFISCSQNKSALLEEGFLQPPDSIRTGIYWYWVSDNISKEGVIEDLHAMKKAGINLAFIGNIGPSTHHDANYPYGKVKFMSEEWWEILHTALKTATELDIEIGIFNSPGWSQSGGPWVQPKQAMRYLASTEIQVSGPRKITETLSLPATDFQDVKVLAFQAGRKNLFDSPDSRIIISNHIRKSVDKDQSYQLPVNESSISLVLPEEETARSILIYPGDYLNTHCILQIKEGNRYRMIKEFNADRDASLSTANGFDQKAPVVESLPETTGKEFRLLFKNTKDRSIISSLMLTPSPVIQRYPGKTFAKNERHGSIPEPVADHSLFVDPDMVLDISEYLTFEGVLNWDVPEGEWVIMRTGMTPTGMTNGPAPPEATGLETDKLSKEHILAHFDAFLGKIYERIPAADRKCWKYTVLDSYEKGGQNITDNMPETFKQYYGYDPVPFLPTYYGYPVGDFECSERFLWDLRRFVADKTACEYVAGLREASHKHGLKTWLENYGHGGFSAEFLQYGGRSDEVAGEFWNYHHAAEKQGAASCAHTYGKIRVWAEAFTNEGRNGSAYQRYPGILKGFGDLAFAQGINCMLLHVYIQQYKDNSYPGVDAWFGTEFNRKNTWYSQIDLFVDYLKRSSFMLQQGLSVADVAYYIGEDTPIMTGSMKPELPKGYYFDFINSEVLIQNLEVVDGRLVLPHGISYRVLVLPPKDYMRPEVLQKIEKLVAAGATVIGTPPNHSPGLQNYPEADKEIQSLAAKMWTLSDSDNQKDKRIIPYGKGRILMNVTLEDAFELLNVLPDCRLEKDDPVLYTHRTLKEGIDIYFLTNQSEQTIRITPQFRVSGKQPELWNAVNGTIRPLPDFENNGIATEVPLQLEPGESTFVVFRNRATSLTSINKENFPKPKQVLDIDTPWEVKFESDEIKRGPEEIISMNQLYDWSQQEDPRIKYYSGTAHYETNISLEIIPEGKLYIDLGEVSVMAKVKVNGKDVGGVWTAPHRLDITNTVKQGKNKIEVEVVNTWINRILGDRQLPEKERKITPHTAPWKADTPLQKSGLSGPVQILSIDY